MTHRELAKKVRMSQPSITHYATLRYRPRDKGKAKFAKHLGIPAGDW